MKKNLLLYETIVINPTSLIPGQHKPHAKQYRVLFPLVKVRKQKKN